MIKFIYSEKNCSIYSEQPRLNTGADEILEVSSDFTITNGPSIIRTLIEFPQSELINHYSEENRFVLNLKVVNSVELTHDCEVEVYPVSEEWVSGKGRFADDEELYPGASWIFRNQNQDSWSTDKIIEVDDGGGSWFTSILNKETSEETDISYFQKFDKVSADLKIDITNLVKHWTLGTLNNNGLIIKFKNDTSTRSGNIKFFSSNTNTIYSPYIEVGIYDFKFNPFIQTIVPNFNLLDSGSLDSGSLDSGSLDSGSLDSGSLDSGSLDSGSLDSGSLDSGSLDSGSFENNLPTDLRKISNKKLVISISELKTEYQKTQTDRIDVGLRERFPTKKFSTRARYDFKNYTDDILFYSIRDAETEEVVIDFSEYTKISCDTGGHYFMFDFSCLNRGRMYKFLLKQELGDTQRIFPDNRTFMVVT